MHLSLRLFSNTPTGWVPHPFRPPRRMRKGWETNKSACGLGAKPPMAAKKRRGNRSEEDTSELPSPTQLSTLSREDALPISFPSAAADAERVGDQQKRLRACRKTAHGGKKAPGD